MENSFQKWLIVFGSFLIYFIADGVTLSIGIFSREFIQYFNKKDSESSVFITAGLIQAVPLFLSPLICYFIDKKGCRTVTLTGSTLLFLSFISTRFLIHDLITLNIIIGIVLSSGLAMVYIPAYIIISYYFDEKRALATGFAVAGSGLGLFVLSPVAEYLIENFGWKNACFLFGAISSHTFISACLFRPTTSSLIKEKAKNSEKKSLFLIFLKNKLFFLVNLSYFILSFVIVAPYIFLPSHIKLRNLLDPNSTCISLIGVSTLVGQILIGYISDLKRDYNWLIYAMCFIVAGVATLILPFLNSINSIFIYSVIFGLSTSVNYVLQSSLVIEAIGLDNLTGAFGCLQLCQGISTLFGAPLLGFLKDSTGDYDKSFYTSGFIMILSAFILLLWPILKNKPLNAKL